MDIKDINPVETYTFRYANNALYAICMVLSLIVSGVLFLVLYWFVPSEVVHTVALVLMFAMPMTCLFTLFPKMTNRTGEATLYDDYVEILAKGYQYKLSYAEIKSVDGGLGSPLTGYIWDFYTYNRAHISLSEPKGVTWKDRHSGLKEFVDALNRKMQAYKEAHPEWHPDDYYEY